MNLFAEPLVGLLGPLQSLLLDDDVTAIHINGPGELFVERGSSRTRHLESMADAPLRALCQAIRQENPGAPEGRLTCTLEGGGQLTLIDEPYARSGAILTIDKGSIRTVALKDVAGGDLTAVLEATLHAGVSVLVVGPQRSARLRVLGALLSALPAETRLVLVEDRPRVRVDHEHLLSLVSEDNVETLGTLMQLAQNLQADWLGLPEVHLGGRAAIHAAVNVGMALACAPGADCNATLALLDALDGGLANLAGGTFRLVLEVEGTQEPPTVRCIKELVRGVDGRTSPVVLWSTTASGGGQWREVPTFASRLGLAAAPWQHIIPDAPRVAIGSMFENRGPSSVFAGAPEPEPPNATVMLKANPRPTTQPASSPVAAPALAEPSAEDFDDRSVSTSAPSPEELAAMARAHEPPPLPPAPRKDETPRPRTVPPPLPTVEQPGPKTVEELAAAEPEQHEEEELPDSLRLIPTVATTALSLVPAEEGPPPLPPPVPPPGSDDGEEHVEELHEGDWTAQTLSSNAAINVAAIKEQLKEQLAARMASEPPAPPPPPPGEVTAENLEVTRGGTPPALSAEKPRVGTPPPPPSQKPREPMFKESPSFGQRPGVPPRKPAPPQPKQPDPALHGFAEVLKRVGDTAPRRGDTPVKPRPEAHP
ncbi:MAG: hypothetical protein AB2A00_43330, partial [Myxococcota bacterium]